MKRSILLRNLLHPHLLQRYSTVYALSTGPGRAAIAIIRISGAHSQDVYRKLSLKNKAPVPRLATVTTLYNPDTREPLDEALVLFFKAPHSYTGEDLLELHVHGGPAVVQGILKALQSLGTDLGIVRYAEPGEFTRKAFYNGRMDLTQVEGVRDIIEAETEYQRKLAMTSATGKAKALYDVWRTKLLESMATLTALVDFSDDNLDIHQTSNALLGKVSQDVEQLMNEVKSLLFQARRAEIIKSGIRMNFLGPPNAGKSSLLNLLVQREAAIVSEIAGTTRDVLEVGIDIGGYKIILGDTAGIRTIAAITHDSSKIELEGIRRARERFQIGDVLLVVLPLGDLEVVPQDIAKELASYSNQKVLVVLNKTDLVPENKLLQLVSQCSKELNIPQQHIIPVSCKTSSGVVQLIDAIKSACEEVAIHGTNEESRLSASPRIQSLLETGLIPSLERYLGTYNNNQGY